MQLSWCHRLRTEPGHHGASKSSPCGVVLRDGGTRIRATKVDQSSSSAVEDTPVSLRHQPTNLVPSRQGLKTGPRSDIRVHFNKLLRVAYCVEKTGWVHTIPPLSLLHIGCLLRRTPCRNAVQQCSGGRQCSTYSNLLKLLVSPQAHTEPRFNRDRSCIPAGSMAGLIRRAALSIAHRRKRSDMHASLPFPNRVELAGLVPSSSFVRW